LRREETEIFFERGLDSKSVICPQGQLSDRWQRL
jgi:hypothetical protein